MFVVGCQSGGMGSSASSAPTKAVLVTGQGSTTVFIPTSDGGIERLASADTPKCAQCESDARHYFLTGELTPKCSACGAMRVPLTDYSKVGHN
jgi:hypothetical protein